MVTRVPTGPVVAVKELIVGGSEKIKPAIEAVPPGVVRLTAPVEPAPTIAMMEVEETTVYDVTCVPPRVITDVLSKFVPVILIRAPAPAIIGEKEVMVGGGINVKPAREAEPPGVVRLTAPVVPVPTMATIEVEETTVKEATGVPPKVITDVPSKFVPVMLITVPAAAVPGAKAVIVGGGMKVNPASEAVPPGVVKLTAPVAPVPMMAIIEVEETTVNEVTGVPPIVTTEVPSKSVPVMLIRVPAAAVAGAKEVIVGAGMKVKPARDAEPPGVVRLTAPVAPVPTLATIEVEETTVNDVTGVPPKVRADVLLKLVPVILISEPAAAVVGLKAVIVGAGINVNPAKVAVPPGVVRLTAPVVPVPTCATMEEEEITVNDVTDVPPKVRADVLLKLVPMIVMRAPAPAAVGVNEVMVGAGIKVNPANEADPLGVVRLTAPVAPVPTTAMMEVEETTVKDVTGVPPSVIIEVLSKFVPVILMSVPAAAVVGVKEVMVGGGGK